MENGNISFREDPNYFRRGKKSYSDLNLRERENKALQGEDLNWTLKDAVS